jgi:hypothetical protein
MSGPKNPKHTSISKTQQITCGIEECQMTMNRQSYREHIINVHPNKNPLDMKVYGEKTFVETMALSRGATVE